MELKILLAMEVGEARRFETDISVWDVLRVPGGWIFESTAENPVFVPEPVAQNVKVQVVGHDMAGK